MTDLGKNIKKLGFGLMRLPKKGDAIDVEQVKKMVDRFLEEGFTYFDTAWAYDGSEDAIRQALVERYPREKFLLATKNAAWRGCKTREEAAAQFDTSLKRTGAGYFDFYLLHNLGEHRTQAFDDLDMWSFIREKKEEGLVRHMGFSFHSTPEELDELLTKHPEMEFVQLQINYVDWESEGVQSRKCYEVARKYITYRYVQSLKRTHNTTDDRILSLIECNNEEVKQENSNKNPTVNSVQRDYMAGEVSKDLTMRMLLPPEVVKAHEEGIIHFHDADYFAQHMHNCDLVNLDDMLQNGTVISGTLIEKPHSFSTACNIATQIIAQVASNQYGGQSISLTHLAPFVDISRKKIRRDVEAEMVQLGIQPGEEKIAQIVETRLREEIKRGVQTIQYQVVTLMTTNGQAPFITVFTFPLPGSAGRRSSVR